MAKIKVGAAVVLSILLIIVILQNTESVETRLLFMTLELPRAVLLLLTLIVGFISGLVVALTLSKKHTVKEAQETR